MREMGEVSFHFIGTNGLEAENERFSFVGRAVVRTSNSISSRHRLADYVKKKIAPESMPRVQHDYFLLIQPIMFLVFEVAVAVVVP